VAVVLLPPEVMVVPVVVKAAVEVREVRALQFFVIRVVSEAPVEL
jgi:hypothetical protein